MRVCIGGGTAAATSSRSTGRQDSKKHAGDTDDRAATMFRFISVALQGQPEMRFNRRASPHGELSPELTSATAVPGLESSDATAPSAATPGAEKAPRPASSDRRRTHCVASSSGCEARQRSPVAAHAIASSPPECSATGMGGSSCAQHHTHTHTYIYIQRFGCQESAEPVTWSAQLMSSGSDADMNSPPEPY